MITQLWMRASCCLIAIGVALITFKVMCLSSGKIQQTPDWSLRRILPLASQIDIGRINSGVVYPFDVLANGSNSAVFLLLQHCNRFHATPPRKNPDFIFQVPFGEGKAYHSSSGQNSCPTYYYMSESGELGIGKDWCYVPTKFKAWMLSIKASRSARHFSVKHLGGVTVVEPLKPVPSLK